MSKLQSHSPSEGEWVPKAGEGLVHGPNAWQEAVEAPLEPCAFTDMLATILPLLFRRGEGGVRGKAASY